MKRLPMVFFNLLKNRKPVLSRCTHCYEEAYLSKREVRTLESENDLDSICPVILTCIICHIGLLIPVNYTDKSKKQYLFHEIKPKLKNLDLNTINQHIFCNHNVSFYFFEDSL